MNFSQISTFRAVMTSQSLSDAAKKLGRTQPAVTASIKALEEQLGMDLFERRGRKLIPVPEAQYLLKEADAILSRMSRVKQTMRSLSHGAAGTLTVAAMPGPVSMIFPKFIASRLRDSEGITVSILARTSPQIAELARAQSLDFGFADAEESGGSDRLFRAEIIEADSMVALPTNHPLARKDKIAIMDLDGAPFGVLPLPHAQTLGLQRAFDACGATLIKAVESQTFLPIFHFVASGQCITVVDPLSVYLVGEKAMVEGVIAKPMAEPIRYRYALYSPRFRPISVVAQNLRDAWRAEVMRLLENAGARPQALGVEDSSSA